MVEETTLTDKVKALREEYKALDIFRQAEQYEDYKAKAESENIDPYMLTCTDAIFKYFLENNLIERF